jgi:hypothetical protein
LLTIAAAYLRDGPPPIRTVLDVVRAAVLAWALLVACRARAWQQAWLLGLVFYVFALEVAGAFTFERQAALTPSTVNLVILLGPSGMPRGDLPPLPFAGLVVQWPAFTNAIVALLVTSHRRRLVARIGQLGQPAEGARALALRRVSSALAAVAFVEGLCALTGQLPCLFGDRAPD